MGGAQGESLEQFGRKVFKTTMVKVGHMTSSFAPVSVGIIGAAAIARQFVTAVSSSKVIDVRGVASRDASKVSEFATTLGIPKTYGSYEAMLADPDIEAVYNPLPNSLHAAWSMKAVAAGKHVLCEKPLAVSGAEAREMFAAARKHGVCLVEAYPYMAQQQTRQVRELVRAGAIGRPQLIRTSFGVPFSDASNIRLKPELAGGALMDAGSYAVSFVRIIAAERPTRVQAIARWTETGVDRTLVGTIEFASGLIAQVAASFATAYHRHAQIAADNGSIETTFLNHPPVGGPASFQIRRGPTIATATETIAVEGGNGFLLEAESFASMVRGGKQHWSGATEEESVDIACALEALLASARSGLPQTLP